MASTPTPKTPIPSPAAEAAPAVQWRWAKHAFPPRARPDLAAAARLHDTLDGSPWADVQARYLAEAIAKLTAEQLEAQ